METIFTKIINREIPASIVYEDELVIAFLDITQATMGHTLVVTKAPYKNLFEVPEETLKHLFGVVQKLSVAIYKAFDAKGLNLLNNNNETAGQTVFHYHVHIIPRYEKDDLTLGFYNHMSELTSDDYKERAALIKAALL
ncbi:HIT family protein [Acholeplasma hippikon]|uniref:Histidine triad (HIT) protein n=1 Tax=Acholeplasma hippikon TaxID=264636 RepID=A0A449BKM9_9MOLU|nr:HIT family protein [Acholeplasma hippikon]VEU83025.1 histidine triad (HIT) protein [Acholeplasma hippikon]